MAADFATLQQDRSDFICLEICLESSSGQLFQVLFIIFLVGFVIPFVMKRILEVLSGLEAVFALKKRTRNANIQSDRSAGSVCAITCQVQPLFSKCFLGALSQTDMIKENLSDPETIRPSL